MNTKQHKCVLKSTWIIQIQTESPFGESYFFKRVFDIYG